MSCTAHFAPATSLAVLIAHCSCSADGGSILPTHGRRKENRNQYGLTYETIKRLVFSDTKVTFMGNSICIGIGIKNTPPAIA